MSDKPTLGPDASSGFVVFSAYRLDGCNCESHLSCEAVFLLEAWEPTNCVGRIDNGPRYQSCVVVFSAIRLDGGNCEAHHSHEARLWF